MNIFGVDQCLLETNRLLRNGTIYLGDNLEYLKALPDQSVDAVITDPPFNSGKQQNANSKMVYDDHWTWHNVDFTSFEDLSSKCPQAAAYIATSGPNMPFLTQLGIRYYHCARILKDTGSFMTMCDNNNVGPNTVLLEHIFGKQATNIIAYKRKTGGNVTKYKFASNLNYIIWTTKTNKSKNKLSIPNKPLTDEEKTIILEGYKEHPVTKELGQIQPLRNRYRTISKRTFLYEWNGIEYKWDIPIEEMKELESNINKEGVDQLYYTKKGVPKRFRPQCLLKSDNLDNLWTDIPTRCKNLDFPTAKPVMLYERLIETVTKPNDLVFDPFAGSGTCAKAAMNLNRKWILSDINPKTIEHVNKSLKEKKDKGPLLNQNVFELEIQIIDASKETLQPYNRQLNIELDTVENQLMKDFLDFHNNPENYKSKKIYVTPELTTHFYNQQKGVCNGCNEFIQRRFATTDHKNPRSRSDEFPDCEENINNLQMLCYDCNIRKGSDTDIEWNEKKEKQNQQMEMFEDDNYTDLN